MLILLAGNKLSNGNAYITGETSSVDFPITENAYDSILNTSWDFFIVKLNQSGEKLIFSTFIGGNDFEYAFDITLDSKGNTLITGYTPSSDFPITPDAYDKLKIGADSVIVKLNKDGSNLIYSSFLGGSLGDVGAGIGADSMDNIYLTGNTLSSDFPTTAGVISPTFLGGSDIFVSKFSFYPTFNITTLQIFKNETPTNLIYSKLCPYTIRVNLTDTISLSDVRIVRLILDPLGINIRLQWNQSTGKFSKISDPDNYIILEPSSKAYNNSLNNWTIDFNITFNWTYPDEQFHDIQAHAASAILSPVWFNATGFYRVENDLVFTGTLKVQDDDDQIINENDLVRGGEKLNWTGLKPIYEGTTNIYPPKDEFDITIWDEANNFWSDSPCSGENFSIQTVVSSGTDQDGDMHKINISKIPSDCDATNEIFMIKIDNDNLIFINPTPDNTSWQTTSDVKVSVKITDIGGGCVDNESIMYTVSQNNGTEWDDWMTISGLESAVSIIAKETVSLKEGRNNLIKWKAADSVGNGPLESIPYKILVDTRGVTFSNPIPISTGISFTEEVEVGITISDTTSGVDVTSIEYTVSSDSGTTWGPWQPAFVLNNGFEVMIQLNLTFPNGTNNRIKWHAYDIAGNGPVESKEYTVNINTWVPQIRPMVTLLSPPNGQIIKNTSVELIWELENTNLVEVTYILYFDKIDTPDQIQMNLETTSFFLDDLEDGETYYWKVVPKLNEIEGFCRGGAWWFKVELPKDDYIYKINLTGPTYLSLYPGENKSVKLSIKNLGTIEDSIKINLEAGKLSEFITIHNSSILELDSNGYDQITLEIKLSNTIEPGRYQIIIIAISVASGETEKDTHKLIIEIKEPESSVPDDSDQKTNQRINDNILIVLMGIIIIIIIFMTITIIIKRKKRKEHRSLTKDAITIKPSTFSTPLLSQDQISTVQTKTRQPEMTNISVPHQPITSVISRPVLTGSATPARPPARSQIPQITQVPPLLPPSANQNQTTNAEIKDKMSTNTKPYNQ